MTAPFSSAARLTLILCLVAVHLLTGCTAASWGVRPEPGNYLEEAAAECKNDPAVQACTKYEEAVMETKAFINAYESRARLNDWAIYVGAVIGLASVGALAGLGAFGLAGSDAAKIIPLVGTFLGGVIAYTNNDAKAAAYDEAANELRDALIKHDVSQHGPIVPDAAAYMTAASALRAKMQAVASRLSDKLRDASSPERRQAGKLEKMEKQLKQAKAAFYFVRGIQVTSNHAEIQLSNRVPHIRLDFQKIEVEIDGVKVPTTLHADDTVTVEIPPGFASSPHKIRVILDDDFELPPYTYP